MAMEEEEKELLNDENELQEELNEYQDKHKQVKLVYEKVFENIKGICKLEGKKIEEVQNSSINNSASNDHSNELDVSHNVIKVVGPSEEEVSKSFIEYLESTRLVIEKLYLTVGKKEFQNLLKERGADMGTNGTDKKNDKTKVGSKKGVNDSKSPHNTNNANIQTNNQEYDYDDEELKEDDKKMKDEYNSMAHEFKKIVSYIIILF